MNESLGTRLRLQRERQQISLATIAADTKIKVTLLEALERDDVSHWPEGIFRRAFVKSYAQAIGLDPAPVLREFLERHPDAAEVSPFDAAAAAATSGESTTRFRRLFTSAIAAAPTRRPGDRREVSTTLTPDVAREYAVAEESAAAEPDMPVGDVRLELEPEPALLPPAIAAAAAEPRRERPEPDLLAVAQLCTRLGRVLDREEIAPVLADAAAILDAVGLIVWSWDARISMLTPSLAHGYSEGLLGRLPPVTSDADNAVATAFRCAETCVVNAGDESTGAAVVPLMAPRGCVGVLAIELRHGGEQRASVRALVTILAAQLVTLLGASPLPEVATV